MNTGDELSRLFREIMLASMAREEAAILGENVIQPKLKKRKSDESLIPADGAAYLQRWFELESPC